MIAQRPATEGDYLPARMLNEFTYCPRLFYYEYVDGQFAHNRETVEGELRHSGLDAREDGLPPPEELAERERPARSRSVMLSSDRYGVIAKMDLVEYDARQVTPVDYKRGRPREAADGSLEA
jgi:CRISPR/Cas system-associated exonuclease Cas4 (RecB family)